MKGEFERLLDLVAAYGVRGLVGVLLIALPVVAVVLIERLHRQPVLRAYWRLHAVSWTAAGAGVLLGWCLMYADPWSPSLRIWSIFEVGGPWDVPWTVFLRDRANPALYEYQALVPFVQSPDSDPVFALVLLVCATLFVFSVAAALICLRGAELVAGLIGIPFVCLSAQALTIYLSTLLAYTFNTLNFWAALVALVMLQYYRRVTAHGGH